MVAHFLAIAEAATQPIVLYNVPGRTATNMLPETICELAQHPNIAAVKEASGNLDATSQIILNAPAGFSLLSGDDSLTLPMISIGGHGVISVASNIVPGAVASLVSDALNGDMIAARAQHLRLFEMFRTMFLENNPTAVKTAAALSGLCTDELRLPLVPLSDQNRARIERVLEAWSLTSHRAA
jgi:4-hydroxy-tetrahydrodipicolinate synthase